MFKDCQCEDEDPSPAKCGSVVDLGDWLEESFPDFTTVAEVAQLAVDMISKPQAHGEMFILRAGSRTWATRWVQLPAGRKFVW